jgi:hypothetical protein
MTMSNVQRANEDVTALWYERATVRKTPRVHVPGYSIDELIYPIAHLAICDHPFVLAAGPEIRSYMLTQAAYQFLYNVALMEIQSIIQGCLNIIQNFSDDLSDLERLQALTVIIDEGYHAHVAQDYILQMMKKSGIEPLQIPKTNQKLATISKASANLPPELRADFEVLALTLTENVLTDQVASLGREQDLAKSFTALMMEHAKDEGRHSIFFTGLMKRRWAKLPQSTQESFGALLPAYLDDYFEIDRTRAFEKQILSGCSFSPDDAAKVISETDHAFIEGQKRMAEKSKARLYRVLKQIGVMDLQSNRQAFAHCAYVN